MLSTMSGCLPGDTRRDREATFPLKTSQAWHSFGEETVFLYLGTRRCPQAAAFMLEREVSWKGKWTARTMGITSKKPGSLELTGICSFLQLCKAQSRSPPSHASPHWLPLYPNKARFPETPTYLVVSEVMWLQHLINKKLI